MLERNWFNDYGVIENEKEYKIQIAAMGFAKGEAKVCLDGNRLEVELHHSDDKKDVFGMKNYKQSFIVPGDVENDTVSASLENGVLLVTLPKQPKTIRQISIC